MRALYVQESDGYRVATRAEIADVAGEYAIQAIADARPVLSHPSASVDYLKQVFCGRDAESFVVIFMNNRNTVIDCCEMFRGTIDGATVHAREVVKAALWRGATSVILAHNHPSGVPDPSRADEIITKRLRDALGLIEVKVLDHIIVGSEGKWSSMSEQGLM